MPKATSVAMIAAPAIDPTHIPAMAPPDSDFLEDDDDDEFDVDELDDDVVVLLLGILLLRFFTTLATPVSLYPFSGSVLVAPPVLLCQCLSVYLPVRN